MLKSLHRGSKGWGSDPWTPPPVSAPGNKGASIRVSSARLKVCSLWTITPPPPLTSKRNKMIPGGSLLICSGLWQHRKASVVVAYLRVERVLEDFTQSFGVCLWFARLSGVQNGAFNTPGEGFPHQMGWELYRPDNRRHPYTWDHLSIWWMF